MRVMGSGVEKVALWRPNDREHAFIKWLLHDESQGHPCLGEV